MRLLFAMLIAVFCWAGSASGKTLCTTQTKQAPAALGILLAANEAGLSPFDPAYRPPQTDLRRKAPGKLPLLLPRVHSYPSSLSASGFRTPAYCLTAELGLCGAAPRQIAPAPSRLALADWTLHIGNQNNRLGGWKESNTLYRGMLTYHS